MNNALDISFECVLPSEYDAKQILAWRNDPETLQMSYHQEPKQWPEFLSEFKEEYFAFPDLPPLFIIKNCQRVGFLRFRPIQNPHDHNQLCCDISINITPEQRDKGIASKALEAIQDWLATRGYCEVYAEVKYENKASKALFEKAGFTKLEDGYKELEEGKKIPIHRYSLKFHSHSKQYHKVFIIGEIGSNWRLGSRKKDLEMAKTLIKLVADAGANAAKFQVFRPETIYAPNAGTSNYLEHIGKAETMEELFSDLSMPYDMIPELAAYCHQLNIEFMASFFSIEDFNAIDPFVKRHKIASYELGHIRLLEAAARSQKPLILSTGAATEHEIAWAVKTYRSFGGKDLTLLQCTAAYPAAPQSLHLNTLKWFEKRFRIPIGLSDHSRHPICAPLAAVAMGAKVIEKHVTLHHSLPGPDHAFALSPSEFKEMVDSIRLAEEMLGSPVKIIDPSEEELRFFARRGIQALQSIRKGDIFTENKNIAILRPGKQPLGVHPCFIEEVQGKAAKRDIPIGSGIMPGDW